MFLTIDIGNTNAHFAIVDDNMQILCKDAIPTKDCSRSSIASFYAASALAPYEIGQVLVSSVAPSADSGITDFVRSQFSKEPLFVGKQLNKWRIISLPQGVEDIIGSDLAVGLSAAAVLYSAPVVVAALGTATTVFGVTKDFVFAGGTIIPGLRTSLDSLLGNAELINDITLSSPSVRMGLNTHDSVSAGLIYGHAGAVDRLVDNALSVVPGACLIASGGAANDVIPYCRHEFLFDADLVNKGLFLIYTK